MPFYVAAEIKDKAILFIRVQTETSSYHLIVETGRCCRPQQYHAVNIRSIKSGSQNSDIYQEFDFPCFEPFQYFCSERWQGISKDCFCSAVMFTDVSQNILCMIY